MPTKLKPQALELVEQSEVEDLLAADDTPWYQKPNLRFLYLCLVPAALGVEMATGYDGSAINGLQAVGPWKTYFGNPNGSLLGIMSAAFPIGSVVVLPIVPWVNDSFGRKPSIVVGALLIIIGVALQTAAQNMGMFLAARLLLGMGIPFSVGGAAQLLAELVHPRDRPVIIGLFSESFYVGSIVAAGITLGTYAMPSTWSWRLPSLFQVVPSLLSLIFIWWIPESPRWLVAKGRKKEALDILVTYHAEGKTESSFVQAEFAEIQAAIELELEGKKRRWIELLMTPGDRHRTFIAAAVGLFLQWSGNGLFAYYLPKILTTCWNLVTGVGGAFVCRWTGRRRQYVVAFTGMTLVFAAFTGASASFVETGNNQAATGVIAMIFVYAIAYNTMMPLTYIYVTEIFPYGLRAKGIAITQTFSRLGSAFSTFVNPIGMDSLGWHFYLIYCGWLVCEWLMIYFFYPETKGPTIEEMAIVFDGMHTKTTDEEGSSPGLSLVDEKSKTDDVK